MLPSVYLLGPECDSDAGPKTVFWRVPSRLLFDLERS